MGIIISPEVAGSKPTQGRPHGLSSVDADLADCLRPLRQTAEERFFVPFEPGQGGAGCYAWKRMLHGRTMVNYQHSSQNEFLNKSELSVYGRPEQTVMPQLPSQRDLLVPEDPPAALLPSAMFGARRVMSLRSPNQDLKLCDRFRPSAEMVCAQRGPDVWASILCSLLRGVDAPGVVVASVTPHVEDVGLAMKNMILGGGFISSMPVTNLAYVSCHDAVLNGTFGSARIRTSLIADLANGKLGSDLRMDAESVELTEQEIAVIPGGEEFSRNLSGVSFEECELQRPSFQVAIKNDEAVSQASCPHLEHSPNAGGGCWLTIGGASVAHQLVTRVCQAAYWCGAADAYKDKFEEIAHIHEAQHAKVLQSLKRPSDNQAGPLGSAGRA